MKVTATVFVPGDPSVGIFDGEVSLDFGTWISYDAFFAVHSREDFRKGLKEWADTYMEECGPCYVLFGDECNDCGRTTCPGNCVELLLVTENND